MAESGSLKNRKSASSSSSSSTSSSSPTPVYDPNSPDAGSGMWGFTEDNTPFIVPDTLNTTEIYLPWNISVGSAISLGCFVTAAYLVAFGGYSKWLHIFIFFFWRLSYDVGLGFILRSQSEHKSFTRFYLSQYAQGGWKQQLLDHLASRQLQQKVRQEKPITEYPQCFRAWLVYKNLVNIILVNDGLTYLLLGIKCFHFPPKEGFTLLVILQYLIGLFLCLFNWWAKVDAHRCIGEFSWYWGDFFFRRDLHLTFDGIFELFPHPMYTVGYSLYYGYSLIARSYTMLFVSLLAHGLQLAFLFFVEEPHIVRTYGGPPPMDKSKSRILYDPKSGWFPDKNDNVFLANFDWFRSGDFAVIFFALYGILFAFLPSDPRWALAQVILWRAIHWLGLGFVLWGQSSFQLWTRHFTTKGRTIYEAFGHWKNTYNLSLTMNIVVFIAAALRYANFSYEHLLSAYSMSCIAVGIVLISLSVWSYTSTYEAVGEFGWFYGDFFISQDQFKQHLCYTSIYRFLNNPECVTGYAGQYGLALLAQSWPIFFLALASHGLNVLFLNLVEIPHMNKLYGKHQLRDESPFPKALKRMKKKVLADLDLPHPLKRGADKLEANFKSEVKKIRAKAMEEVFEIYKKLSDKRRKMSMRGQENTTSSAATPLSPRAAAARQLSSSTSAASTEGVSLSVPAHIPLGSSLPIRFSASASPSSAGVGSTIDRSSRPVGSALSKSSYDWIGVYPVEVGSQVGSSEGRYMYVEPKQDGEVIFPPTLLPTTEGVYEARYHRNNGYSVVASHPFILVGADNEEEEIEEEEGTPAESPNPAEEETETTQ